MSEDLEIVTRSHNLPATHPGEILRFDFMEPEKVSVARLAKGLGVSRQAVNDLVKEHNPSAVSPEMATRLEICTGVSAGTWLGLQKEYDLWKYRQLGRDLSAVQPFSECVAAQASRS